MRREFPRLLGGPSMRKKGENEDIVWDSGLRVYRSCPFIERLKRKLVLVPLTLLLLARGYSTPYEYLVKATYLDLDDVIVVNDEYCVPEQRVSAASVDAKDDCPARFNVSIHKHPDGVDDFSETDWQNIIQNNTVNLLIVDGSVARAVVRWRMPCGEYLAFSIPKENIIFYVSRDIRKAKKKAEELKKEIEEKAHPLTYHGYTYRGRDGFP